jgi:hypothetical protein
LSERSPCFELTSSGLTILLDAKSTGYDPSLAPAIVYIIIFALITIIQIVQVGRSRIWWLVVLVIGGVGECLGWAGRAWAWSNPYDLNAFLLQIIAYVSCGSFPSD